MSGPVLAAGDGFVLVSLLTDALGAGGTEEQLIVPPSAPWPRLRRS